MTFDVVPYARVTDRACSVTVFPAQFSARRIPRVRALGKAQDWHLHAGHIEETKPLSRPVDAKRSSSEFQRVRRARECIQEFAFRARLQSGSRVHSRGHSRISHVGDATRPSESTREIPGMLVHQTRNGLSGLRRAFFSIT